MKNVKRVNSELSSQGTKYFFIFLSFIVSEMMNVIKIYCGNHFTMYVSQTIMLYTLNLYSVVCQLYLNKTGQKTYKFLNQILRN